MTIVAVLSNEPSTFSRLETVLSGLGELREQEDELHLHVECPTLHPEQLDHDKLAVAQRLSEERDRVTDVLMAADAALRIFNSPLGSVSTIRRWYGLSGNAQQWALPPRPPSNLRLVVDDEGRPYSVETQLVNAAAKYEPARRALGELRGQPTWCELYHAFEVVQSHVGSDMFAYGWIARSAKERFKQTAQSAAAIGKSARHGNTLKFPPPKHPMSWSAANHTIRNLVVQWVLSLAFPEGTAAMGEST